MRTTRTQIGFCPGGALKGSLGGAVPPTLFKTKIAHFATLFKTRDTIFLPCCFVLHTELSNFSH